VRPTSDTSRLEDLGVEIAIGDLTSPSAVAAATEGVRCVFHCGALVSDWATSDEIARINVEGTKNVLEAAASGGVERVVHFSTTDVYGYPGTTRVDESHVSARFANWYSQTKRDAEAEVRRAGANGRLETVILRPATVYGPHSKDVVGEMAKAIRGGNMVLVGGGHAVAGLCYVDNLVDAAVLAMRRDGVSGEAFNVTDGLDVTWKQFADAIAEGLGCPAVRWTMPYWAATGLGFSLEHGYRLLRRTTRLRTRPLLSRQAVHVLGINQDFSNRKAREVLGWEPAVGYGAGLEATLEWLRVAYPW
jgi:nucleoside-diphosphate-sugar epimerase